MKPRGDSVHRTRRRLRWRSATPKKQHEDWNVEQSRRVDEQLAEAERIAETKIAVANINRRSVAPERSSSRTQSASRWAIRLGDLDGLLGLLTPDDGLGDIEWPQRRAIFFTSTGGGDP